MADVSPIRVYVGDDWLQPVALVDTTGAPIDLSGASVGADFWPSNMAAPVDLVGAGGGVTVLQLKPALVMLVVPRTVTGAIEQQSVLQRFYPTRAALWVIDSQNHRQTVQLIPFQPLRARDTDLPSAAAVLGTVTAVLSPQGLAGPSQTINGHTGPVITLSAHDVGAYTQGEVDAAVAAAVASLQQALTSQAATLTSQGQALAAAAQALADLRTRVAALESGSATGASLALDYGAAGALMN